MRNFIRASMLRFVYLKEHSFRNWTTMPSLVRKDYVALQFDSVVGVLST